MKKTNQKTLEEIIRVDHAGERGAIKIYEGQLLALKTIKQDNNLKDKIDDNNVRIKHHSIGINYIDTYHRSGLYPLPQNPPICPGLEASGEIIGLGKDVINLNIGDKICYASTPIGAYCGVRDYPSEKVVKIPNSLSTDDAASILLKGMTVEYLFERLYQLKKNGLENFRLRFF